MLSRLSAVSGALLVALARARERAGVPTIEPLKPCYVTAGTAAKPQAEGVDDRRAGLHAELEGRPHHRRGAVPGRRGPADRRERRCSPLPPVPGAVRRARHARLHGHADRAGQPGQHGQRRPRKATALGVTIRPKRARPSQRIRFKGPASPPTAGLRALRLRGRSSRKRVPPRRRTGECGTWSRAPPADPGRRPGHRALWIVQFDQSKKYVDGTKRHARTSVFVRLRHQRHAASAAR